MLRILHGAPLMPHEFVTRQACILTCLFDVVGFVGFTALLEVSIPLGVSHWPPGVVICVAAAVGVAFLHHMIKQLGCASRNLGM